ncbi:growth hormone secretagogue receptor type 1-like [Antedon mediterranea]|uniref:growth hormone secretagogue receptor type 1-like n=1 Tax=Antedon mediterranea TaxID=105859 RepID=UPI003AF4F162
MDLNFTEESWVAVKVGCGISITGFILNILGLIVINRVTSMRWSTRWFIFSQSLIDAIGCFIYFLHIVLIDPLGLKVYCKVFAFNWSISAVSTVNLIFITIERYFAIMKPFWFEINYTPKRTLLMIVSAWIIGFLLNPQVVVYVPIQMEYEVVCGITDLIIFYPISGSIFLLMFISTLLTMAFVYGSIIRELRLKRQVVLPISTAAPSPPSIHVKTLKVCLAVSTAYILCFLPVLVFTLLFASEIDLGTYIGMIGADFSILNYIVNPVIYTLSLKQFRTEILKCLSFSVFRISPDQSINTITADTNLKVIDV